MSAVSDALLCRALLERHPTDAATLLDGFDSESSAVLLGEAPPEVAAVVIGRMTPAMAATCVSSMTTPVASAIVALMPTGAACVLLRRMSRAGAESLLAELPQRLAALFHSALEFPPASAGAVMDPRVMTLTADLSIAESLDRLRGTPSRADDELYVVDRDQRLLGVIPARVLVGASPDARAGDIMSPAAYRVSPRASLDVVRANLGWAEARTLPVVSEDGRLLGVIGFGTAHQPGGPALTEILVGTLASFSELAYEGSTLVLSSLLAAMSERSTGLEEQGS